AILEVDELVVFHVDRPDGERTVGDSYLGQVEAVLPGIQAASADIGTEKAAFLHVSDIARDDADADEEDENGNGNGNGNGERRNRRYPPIQELVKKGERLIVQATKEPIGTKGPRIPTQISLPGRILALMPHSAHVDVRRKIEDREEQAHRRAPARGS